MTLSGRQCPKTLRALQWASSHLKHHRDFILKVISKDGQLLKWASDESKGEVVLQAVSQNWQALRWAPDELKGDREVVLQAASQNWQALQWAFDELKGDREVVLQAASQNWQALRWASDELKRDPTWFEIGRNSGRRRFSCRCIPQRWSRPSPPGLLLTVSLLSGRRCTLPFTTDDAMDKVKMLCVRELGLECLDQKHLVSGINLVSEEGVIINSLSERLRRAKTRVSKTDTRVSKRAF